MINWFKSIFGKGTVRIEFVGVDRQGEEVTAIAKIPYVGVYDEIAAIRYLKEQLLMKEDLFVIKAKIL